MPQLDDLSLSAEYADAIADARFRARSKLVDRVRGHEFDLGNLLGESKRTFGLVGDTIARIAGMGLSLRRGDLAGAMRHLGQTRNHRLKEIADKQRANKALSSRDISAAHLELTYGVVPLLSDVHAATEAYAVLNATHERRSTFKTHAKSNRNDLDVSSAPGYYNWPGQLSVGCSLKVTLREELSAPRSLGLLDPAGVLWEVTPWSFVADWFIPIGSYLDQLSVLPFLNTSDVWESLYIVAENTSDPVTKYPYGCSDWSAGYSFSGIGIKSKVIRVQRYPTSLSVGQLLRPRFKPLSKAFSPTHIANGIALLHQVLGGLSKSRL